MQHARSKREMITKFCSESTKAKYNTGNPSGAEKVPKTSFTLVRGGLVVVVVVVGGCGAVWDVVLSVLF